MYWSGTEYPTDPNSTWGFATNSDNPSDFDKPAAAFFYVWAVLPGNVAASVPEPSVI